MPDSDGNLRCYPTTTTTTTTIATTKTTTTTTGKIFIMIGSKILESLTTYLLTTRQVRVISLNYVFPLQK